jgi:hypothetical protein
MSDLQRRSEALLRQRGYLTGSCERRKTFPAKGRQRCDKCGQVPLISIASDLWNVFDLIAIRPANAIDPNFYSLLCGRSEMVFVQVTSADHHATRRNKILASSEAKLCILAGCSILIQSWKKVQHRYQAHDEWITVDQFVQGLPDTAEQFYEDQDRLRLLDRKKRLPALPPGSTLPLSEDGLLEDGSIPF